MVKKHLENHYEYYLIGIVAVLLLFNQWQLFNLSSCSGALDVSNVLPAGIPSVYGAELGVSYDGISVSNPSTADQTIAKMSQFDRSINLDGNDMQRYIGIASQISCEYCCGSESIIFKDGQAACVCAHSQAMRGLAKYLVKNHGTQFTDDQVLEELGKWKTLFFPGVMAQKAAVLKQKGIELNYINLASNKYRGIETGASSSGGGGMVGGC